MVRKKKQISAWYLFIACIIFIVMLMFWLVPGSEKAVSTDVNAPLPGTEVPVVCIREDTCEALLQNFCGNHGNVKYSKNSSGNKYEITLYNFGANKNLFYSNNANLLQVKDKGFKIDIHSDTLNAIFTKREINGSSCVELPTDVLFALMSQHPLIK